MSEEFGKQSGNTQPGDGSSGKKGKKSGGKKCYKGRIDPTHATIGNFDISINKDVFSIDAFKLLEQLCLLRDDTSMSKEEKTEKMKELLKDQML